MKIRTGFVSNSSSSSFVIHKSKLTKKQRDKIWDHIDIAKDILNETSSMHEPRRAGDVEPESSWRIEETNETIAGYTSMDNFSMVWFLKRIGVSQDDIEWKDW